MSVYYIDSVVPSGIRPAGLRAVPLPDGCAPVVSGPGRPVRPARPPQLTVVKKRQP